MKIKIDAYGYLWINNRGKSCPYCQDNMLQCFPCGSWCALFGEPDTYLSSPNETSGVFINLCHNSIECLPDDFTDERKAP